MGDPFLPVAVRGIAVSPPLAATLVGRFYPEWNREYPVCGSAMSLGSASGDTIRIPDPRIAAHQARILRGRDGYGLEAGGEGSTTLNGLPLRAGERRALAHGDVVGLSGLAFEFTLDHTSTVLGRLCVVAGVHRGKWFRIDQPNVLIGRAADNHVQFPDRSVSRRHCRIQRQGSGWWIEDLVSRNGTVLNGERIYEPRVLCPGDEVSAGYSCFRFEENAALRLLLRGAQLPPWM